MDESIEVLIFRHGETDWNRLGRLQGHSDIPLNTIGEGQAAELSVSLAETLAKAKNRLVYSSPLSRAVSTARIVSRSEPNLSPLLSEANLGQVEGLTYDEIVARFGIESIDKWSPEKNPIGDFSFPEGETRMAVRERMFQFFRELVVSGESGLGTPDRKSLILVGTHGLALRTFLSALANRLVERIPNCACYSLRLIRAEPFVVWPEPHFAVHSGVGQIIRMG